MFVRPRRQDRTMERLAALDCLRAKIMIADTDLNIIYMNPAVTALMTEAEEELKRELPRFSMATLLGSNIDVFHKAPDHQRRMLAALDKPHSATIRIGQRAFDLLVTPIVEQGRRAGFVVEWEDAHHRLLNLDYAAHIAAIGRVQAVIEFGVDGTSTTANDNFLNIMGYERSLRRQRGARQPRRDGGRGGQRLRRRAQDLGGGAGAGALIRITGAAAPPSPPIVSDAERLAADLLAFARVSQAG